MTTLIRKAGAGDVAAIFAIRTSVRQNHLSHEEMAARGITPTLVAELLETTGPGWIAEINGEPAGFAMADLVEACVFALFVAPGFEGRGVGRLLLAEAERALFARHERIWLETGTGEHIRANGFYRRMGWQAVGPAENDQTRYEKARPAFSGSTSRKGYWMGMVSVEDAENYPRYVEANAAAFAKYGATFLVRGGRHESPEGPAGDRHVVVEFSSFDQALACYRSPEYQAALELRRAFSSAHFVIVEGV